MTADDALLAWATASLAASVVRRQLADARAACERFEAGEPPDSDGNYPGAVGVPCCFALEGLPKADQCAACQESWALHRTLRAREADVARMRRRALDKGLRLLHASRRNPQPTVLRSR